MELENDVKGNNYVCDKPSPCPGLPVQQFEINADEIF